MLSSERIIADLLISARTLEPSRWANSTTMFANAWTTETGDSVVVLGVNKAQELKEIAPFADELGIRFPLIANQAGDIAGRYGAQNLPTSYFINSDGTIGLKKTGVMNYTFIKAHIDQLK